MDQSRIAVPVTWKALQAGIPKCTRCDLYRFATQAVSGEGSRRAHIVFIGEQPGDQEDLQGRPFVGPAGKLLDRALEDASIDRGDVFVTNAVKHFKFEERGKRRIHKKPSAGEVQACQVWLEAELLLIKPEVIVCLGATAARSVLGASFRLTQHRGEFQEHRWAPYVTATIHPSAILRAPDDDSRHREYDAFVADLRAVKSKSRGSQK
jgi:uracil-DNA glycosylase